MKNAEALEKEKAEPKPQLDLGFKEGETIKINMKITVGSLQKKLNISITIYEYFFRKKTEVKYHQELERRLADWEFYHHLLKALTRAHLEPMTSEILFKRQRWQVQLLSNNNNNSSKTLIGFSSNSEKLSLFLKCEYSESNI